jgi:flagellar hook protein FlgE
MKTSASSVALSGLNAADTALAVSANNVANGASGAFAPSRVHAEAAEAGGVKVSISQDAARGVGADYAAEMVAQSRGVATYQANLKTVQAADETAAVAIQLGQQ